ncbi:serine/threonine-protein kinase [Nonomuraea indica]|uniref:Protein kinase n=1 Tax=Nonomuraea indica TaxID=1581193 RepID=A0ABW8AA40_9ACTN
MNDDRLGPYRLLRRLGEGGMGVVHLAVDPQGRQVAVKVLRSEVAGDEVARRRLSREVETMRRVRGRYIAEVLDADVTGHRPYIVTRYVAGRALDEIVKDEGPLELPALVRIAHGVASALAAVHAGGVIHRDLKPGNVLVVDGDPILIDFGIAQAVDATRLTQTGMFIGTPGFLAPEIIEGQEAGPEVDVHAWAGTLLYAATGQPPFGKGTLEMIFYNITAGKAEIGAAPAPLQPLLKAAFQRNPAKRPKAAELAEQTARMLPRSYSGVPDEISTVPRPDLPPPTPVDSRPAYEISTPPVTPRRSLDSRQAPFAPHQSLAHPSGPQLGGPHPNGPHPNGPHPNGPHPNGPHPNASGPNASGPNASGPNASGPNASGPYPSGPQHGLQPHPGPGEPPGRPAAGPGVPPYGSGPHAQGGPAPDQPYVSLLPDQGDPWPTRRVTPEELRRIQEEGAPPQPWQPPQAADPAPSYEKAPPYEGDVPTRRVRPDTPDYGRPSGPGYSAGPNTPGYPPAPGAQHGPGPGQQRPHQQQPPPYIPAQPAYPPDPQTKREPFIPGARPGQALQRSKAYGVAGAMLLVVMAAAAVVAPVLVAVVAVPAAVLLRAADLAQRDLTARRSTGAAALDVVLVFAHPRALAKSAGITLALTLYALILGLPVTLLLTVSGTDAYNALACGAAVALLTVCAGPGVEGPGRQMRRTLSSLVPSRTAAMVLAGVLAVSAALSVLLAYSTIGDGGRRAVWAPLDVAPVVEQLNGLKGDSGG